MADRRYIETPVLHYREIAIFQFFKIAAVHHIGFLKLKYLTAMHLGDTLCIVLPNFVNICHTFAVISQFFPFSSEM